MRLTGAQLLSIFRRSQNALGEDARLIFSGLGKNTINGRSIQKDELYRVVVVEFLANGGDGYGEFRKGKMLCLRVCRSDKWSFMHCEIRRLCWFLASLPL